MLHHIIYAANIDRCTRPAGHFNPLTSQVRQRMGTVSDCVCHRRQVQEKLQLQAIRGARVLCQAGQRLPRRYASLEDLDQCAPAPVLAYLSRDA